MRNKDEWRLQCDIVSYVRSNYPQFRISAIPNGGSRNAREAANMKKSGTLAGEPDLLIRMPGGATWNIEVKTSQGRQSKEQKDMEIWCEENGHIYCLVRSVEDMAFLLRKAYPDEYRK